MHNYGWRPSLPDFRDQYVDPTQYRTLLPEVDPRGNLPPVYNQGQLGSCTANAVAAAVEYDAKLKGEDFGTPSRLFIYYQERVLEGSVSRDAGAMGRDGFKACKNVGVPPESDWPYNITTFAQEPSEQSYLDAELHKITSYKHVTRDQSIWKGVLANNQTIAFGFTVYESFESQQVANTGVVPMPQNTERVLGGHEVLAVGYLLNSSNYVLCRNSWGASWGLEGYFLMPWDYVMNSNLASDFRTIPR